MDITCNEIQCNTNCKKVLNSDCVILSGACQDLCYIDFCNDTPTLTTFLTGLCNDFLTLKLQLDCMKNALNPTCAITFNSVTVTY